MVTLGLPWNADSTSRIVHLAQVVLQFTAAVIAIALNASDIAAGPTNTGASVYAIAIGSLSTLTAILFAIDILFPFPSRLWLLWVLFWQWVLTFAWTGVIAAFRGRYFDNRSTQIEVAAGFNIANMLLWLTGSVFGTITMCFRRKLGGKKPDDPGSSHDLSERPC
ncbi:uncharacterized protein Z520_04318 [Fonsecaea multimorphosa CBS 102226]|uniref:MARVEL domain-containing protein n=1 Tax=Fonsecaea multimorphosa CBS 102226 TaxID=1442371 RepID=A0A0D2KSI2_9EURO|nr:uncharacterized protein Z520_04318 [Fonsecaea multimorphosa CBS 102226]KIX99683.1 hypothetical protein Z520_04318 [Fonsecaea multimorphosa CBS 102226]OAL26734.1 hypothetical protein AYO22_04087 [Fonsecaea multimorphosa]